MEERRTPPYARIVRDENDASAFDLIRDGQRTSRASFVAARCTSMAADRSHVHVIQPGGRGGYHLQAAEARDADAFAVDDERMHLITAAAYSTAVASSAASRC